MNKINKILGQSERLVFWAFIILIPLQTRIFLHYPSPFSEWLSVSVYISDILFVFLLGFWVPHLRLPSWARMRNYDRALAVFTIVAGVSVLVSTHKLISLWAFIKLVESVVLFLYIRFYAVRRFGFDVMAKAIVLGGLLQAVIAVGQYVKQGSLGLHVLGESLLDPFLNGVAIFFNTAGVRVMRAYGTTPHPNILAAYLLLALLAFYYVYFKTEEIKKPFHFRLDDGPFGRVLLFTFCYWILLFAFFLTFSRTIIFVLVVIWAGSLISHFVPHVKYQALRNKKYLFLCIATIAFSIGFSVVFWPDVSARAKLSSKEEAVELRVYYNKQAFETRPQAGLNIIGVGIGNYVAWQMDEHPNLDRYLYQPAHNIYLLIYSETGLLGIATFLAFLFFLVKERYKNILSLFTVPTGRQAFPFILFASFLFICLFDHFPWTLQPGRLMLWGILGLLAYAVRDPF